MAMTWSGIPKRLSRGGWGVLITIKPGSIHKVKVGDRCEVKTRYGRQWTDVIAKIVSSDPNEAVVVLSKDAESDVSSDAAIVRERGPIADAGGSIDQLSQSYARCYRTGEVPTAAMLPELQKQMTALALLVGYNIEWQPVATDHGIRQEPDDHSPFF